MNAPTISALTVEDTFWLEGNGVVMLILRPNFSVPPGWEQRGWNQRTEPVVVAKPDGQQIEATAQINLTHVNISDPSVSISSTRSMRLNDPKSTTADRRASDCSASLGVIGDVSMSQARHEPRSSSQKASPRPTRSSRARYGA